MKLGLCASLLAPSNTALVGLNITLSLKRKINIFFLFFGVSTFIFPWLQGSHLLKKVRFYARFHTLIQKFKGSKWHILGTFWAYFGPYVIKVGITGKQPFK